MTVYRSISQVGTTEPFELQVARGQILHHKHLFKFGNNPTVGNSIETIWAEGGLYSYLSAATVLKVSSSNTADAEAGTGARTVELFGLDADYNEINETVTLNGQTAVNTTKEYLRINRMIVRSAGTGGQNAGVIYAGTGTVTSGVPANKYATINGVAGSNQSLMALWTIPAGYTGFLVQYDISNGTSTNTPAVCKLILSIRPGITDFSSIVFSDEGDILKDSKDPDLDYNQLIRPWKSRLALFYVQNSNFIIDLKIIYLTIYSLINKKRVLNKIAENLKSKNANFELIQVAKREKKLIPTPPPGMNEIVSSR